MTYLMMNNLITATLLCALWSLLYFFVSWIVFVAAKGADGSVAMLFARYLPTAILNILTLPVYYYAVRAVMKTFKLMENDELSF